MNPNCLVKDGGGPFQPTPNGLDITPGNTVTVILDNAVGVVDWYLEVAGTDELTVAPVLANVDPFTNKVLTPATLVTFTMPSANGRALLFRSTVTGGLGTATSTFAVYTVTDLGVRVAAAGETVEGNTLYGWATVLNPLVRDGAPTLRYDDTLVAPPLGAATVQDALDALKVSGGLPSGTGFVTVAAGVGGVLDLSSTAGATGQLVGLDALGNPQILEPSGLTTTGAYLRWDGSTWTTEYDTVRIGTLAGNTTPGTYAVAVGYQAGQNTQGTGAIALGYSAGNGFQGIRAVAIGREAGVLSQGLNAVGVGYFAGKASQGTSAVAVGVLAGEISQGESSVAVGDKAGQINLGLGAVAVGRQAFGSGSGVDAVAIGDQAGNDITATAYSNYLVLNATGIAFPIAGSNRFQVKPVRAETAISAATLPLVYDSTTGEIMTVPMVAPREYVVPIFSYFHTSTSATDTRIATRSLDLNYYPAAIGALTRRIRFFAVLEAASGSVTVKLNDVSLGSPTVITGSTLVRSSPITAELDSGVLSVADAAGSIWLTTPHLYEMVISSTGTGTCSGAWFSIRYE